MTTTFAAFCAEVQGEVGDITAAMLVRIANWSNEKHKEICLRRRWKWLDCISDTITIAQANYPFDISSLMVGAVTTPASKILDVVDMDYTPNFALVETTMEEIRNSYQDYAALQSGPPQYWYPWTPGFIKMFPNVDAAGRNYSIKFRKAVPTYPNSASTVPLAIPDDWKHVLRNLVAGKCFRWLDDTRSVQYEADGNNGLLLMENDDSPNTVINDRRPSPPNGIRFPLLSKDS